MATREPVRQLPIELAGMKTPVEPTPVKPTPVKPTPVEHRPRDPERHFSIEVTDDVISQHEPLYGVTKEYAEAFYDIAQLPIEREVFKRGVIALRHQPELQHKFIEDMEAESIEKEKVKDNPLADHTPHKPIPLRIFDLEYTELESETLYAAWTKTEKISSQWETFKNLSRLHHLLIVTCVYAAMTQGWDQAAMAGAAIEVMKDLGKPIISSHPAIPTRRADNGGPNIGLDHNTWLLGLTVGVPFFAGAILGLLMTDPITSVLGFGRRGAICVAGVLSFVSVIGSASVNKWEHLLGFRVLLGAGMAGKASIVPILLSETSPMNIRGILLVFWQLFVAFGLAAGSITNFSVYRLDTDSSWRYMFIAAFIPALLLLSLVLFSPESPRWLLKESGARAGRDNEMMHRRAMIQQAYKSLVDLRGEASPVLAAGEIFLLHRRLIDEQGILKHSLSSKRREERERVDPVLGEVVGHIGWWPRLKLMFFRRGPARRAHMAAGAVMISQQLCGINLIAFLADTFFRYSFFHHDHNTSPSENVQLLGASLGLMLLNFLATIPALFIMDRSNGRRLSLLCSFPCMAISLLGAALVLKAPEAVAGKPNVSTIASHYIFLALFIIAYSLGAGPAAFVVSAEVFPLVNRELGMSLAVFWNFIGAGLLAVVAPWLLKEMDQLGVLLLFAGLNMIAWGLCFWLVPSTGNEVLEDVLAVLEIPLGWMLGHRIQTFLQRPSQLHEYLREYGRKAWEECGYLGEPGGPVEEYKKHRDKQEKQRKQRTDNSA
ncbi:major facilitator superfamily domain-containing protein [Boeremia exigua]|uniref:major facilitator superfamily domain-containing protein n=1 Tax=Boeremia exigua TaxID=749465 RepID=UPI001E8DCCF1|nr:major facilitator superfamily domain-containing protein [Boeremia exigua]KAH6629841.1 major facilitator superfamily domain-containing protein [Boeremia exigua]